MKILVQKFGGTSVSTHEKRQLVIQKIKTALDKGYKAVVVVSAMGRKGDSYATDTLLSLISDKFKKESPLGMDLLMSCGEIISSVVMADELTNSGVDAIPLLGGQAGIITDDNFNNANVLKVDTKIILKVLEENQVPVIAGFQGLSDDGFITTLGRGGSDVSAALIGAALNAYEIEIYTDVDGIMTADPRIVKDASLIKEMNYNDIFQFADQGAKVIHPRAVEIAMNANIPLIVRNTMSDSDGTVITNSSSNNSDKIITGITHMNDRIQILIGCNENVNNDNYDTFLEELAKNQISIDLINVFPKEKIFTIDSKDIEKFRLTMKDLKINYNMIENCSKIAIIGSRMRGIPGVMSKILKTLTKEGIDVLQTADSHSTIWCLVESKDAQKAIKSLHKEFNLN